MRYFKSDNTAAVSREILDALGAANSGTALAYGADRWSEALNGLFGKFFETEVRVFAVSSGTAANSLAIATLCPPWGTVLTHAEAHIERDECGAPEFFSGGAKLSLVGGAGAKIAAADLESRLAWFEPHVHGVQPKMLSITQATERGAVYTPAEIRALADIAHARGMSVHMDGARFANAVVAQKVSPAELSWKAGVDVLSFGVIKNGGMNAEAVVFFKPEQVGDFEFRRKRAGQLACKGRYAAVQISTYLETGLWRRPTLLLAILTLAVGLLHGRITAYAAKRQVLCVTESGLSVGGRFFRRFSATWAAIDRIDIADKSAAIVMRDGRTQTFDLIDIRHGNDVTRALARARTRLDGVTRTPAGVAEQIQT